MPVPPTLVLALTSVAARTRRTHPIAPNPTVLLCEHIWWLEDEVEYILKHDWHPDHDEVLHCTSHFNHRSTQTPSQRTLQRPLVPKRVCSLHASLSPPPLGILHATPDARPPPLATAPQARPQISDQAPQKRNAQTEVRILDPILCTAYPPCSPDNALTYLELPLV